MKCEKFRNKSWMDLQVRTQCETFRNRSWMELQSSSEDIQPRGRAARDGLLSSRIRTLLMMITGTTRFPKKM